MGTAERRLEILKYLCTKKHVTMRELAEKYNVSIRTIQRDIFEIESTFHAPIVTQRGHYGGGVSIVGNYSFDHAYMNDAEIALLQKIQKLVKNQCSESENALLAHIIQKYKISS